MFFEKKTELVNLATLQEEKKKNGLITTRDNYDSSLYPYKNFTLEDMEIFYRARQYLVCTDASEFLDSCICKQRLELTYGQTEYISTRLVMDKLDAALYYWRELNPELVRLLSSNNYVKRQVISNWVKMIHFLAPLPHPTSKFQNQ